jgi:hypothetical protein
MKALFFGFLFEKAVFVSQPWASRRKATIASEVQAYLYSEA